MILNPTKPVLNYLAKLFASPLTKIIFLVLIWRICLGIIVSYTIDHYPYHPTFPYYNSLLKKYGPRSLTTWAQFDGVHYLTIITKGYKTTNLIQAFFPLYPMLVSILSFYPHNPVIIGMIFSTLCFTIGLFGFYQLMKLEYSEIQAWKAIFLTLLFPSAYYFACVYSEGLFFLSVIMAFYFARKRQFFIAGLFGVMVTSCRIVGVAIIPALMWEYFTYKKDLAKTLVFGLLPTLGIGAYILYQGIVLNDPLMFYHVQDKFGTARDISRLIFLPQVFFRYIHMIITTPTQNPIYYNLILEIIAGLFGTLTILLGWLNLRKSYLIFATIAFLLPTLTGTFTGLPRYLLPLFPIPLLLSVKLSPNLYKVVLFIFAFLLGLNLFFFTQGRWVA